MILDLKRIELNQAIHSGALWIVEQVPGYVYTYESNNSIFFRDFCLIQKLSPEWSFHNPKTEKKNVKQALQTPIVLTIY